MRLAIDWDDTLVHDGVWLPGAASALRRLSAHHSVIIHSSRATWAQGRGEIEGLLREKRLELAVVGKPDADLYIDNRALVFAGDWAAVQREVRDARRRARQT